MIRLSKSQSLQRGPNNSPLRKPVAQVTVTASRASSLRACTSSVSSLEKVERIRCALQEFGKLEAVIAKTLINELAGDGIETWGLGGDLERLLGSVKGGEL